MFATGFFHRVTLFVAPPKHWAKNSEVAVVLDLLQRVRQPFWEAARIYPPLSVIAKSEVRLVPTASGILRPRQGFAFEFVCGAQARFGASQIEKAIRGALPALTNGSEWEEFGIADHFTGLLGFCEVIVTGDGVSACYLASGFQK